MATNRLSHDHLEVHNIGSHDSKHKRSSSNGSVRSIASSHASRHEEYLKSLIPPSPQIMEEIALIQTRKEEEILQKRIGKIEPHLSLEERDKAAALIQRNYRGYRERRQIKGMGLDPTSRWMDAIREARYRDYTQPRARLSLDGPKSASDATEEDIRGPAATKAAARKQWRKIGYIARRAVADENSSDDSTDEESIPDDQRAAKHKLRDEKRKERQKTAKIMDLQYWLEAVDVKHRYGSNLRTYHEEWKKSRSKENFFYWLDYGEGKDIAITGVPRTRLESERVRYLSREERLHYLVKVDKEGRLCWAKNGARIDTTVKYKDSINGIVPAEDAKSPRWTAPAAEAAIPTEKPHSSSSSESGSDDEEETARADRYATPDFDKAKKYKKVKHVTAATIFNKLLRGSVKKNTWIFVADTSFRLYVGIKQSGAFQHSSFLHGSRISAAGLIKIKDGRIEKLSPLSGHYRPPVASFRNFVHSLKDEGVDMSHVSISRSYAVLVGLEAYVRTRKKGKRLLRSLVHHRDKILSPDELRECELAAMDRSESAARERRFLELQQEEEDKRNENKANIKLLHMLHVRPRTPKHEGAATEEHLEGLKSHGAIDVPGSGPESAIAPEGTRKE